MMSKHTYELNCWECNLSFKTSNRKTYAKFKRMTERHGIGAYADFVTCRCPKCGRVLVSIPIPEIRFGPPPEFKRIQREITEIQMEDWIDRKNGNYGQEIVRREMRFQRRAENALHIISILWLLGIIAVALIMVSGLTGKSEAALLHEAIFETSDLPAETVDKPELDQYYNDAAWQTEDGEDAKIEAALLSKANRIDNCRVTWYLNSTCGKKPGDPAYGITRSGEPTYTHCTVAVDPALIPLGSDVCVQYPDGSREWFRATDTGVIGAAVDIYTDDESYAIQMGRKSLTVWYIPPVAVDKN